MHKILRRYLFFTASILMLCGLFAPEQVHAIGVPHDVVPSCGTCHGGGWPAMFSTTPSCIPCHESGAGNTKPFAVNDGSKPTFNNITFGNFTTTATPNQISHAWGVPYNNVTAGASRPFGDGVSTKSTNVSCGACHWAHAAYYPKALRIPTDASAISLQANVLCIRCHSARDVTSSIDNVAPKTNSHPVNVQLTDEAKHFYPPRIAVEYENISSSVLKIFSTIGGKDTVHCKTCHGVHYTDSNPFTNDTPYDNLSTGDGYLLRRYNDSTMCKDCHKYQDHGSMTCRNCHTPHNIGNNTHLITWQNLSTPTLSNTSSYGKRTVLKPYTARGFVTASLKGNGLCETCHRLDTASTSGVKFANWSAVHFDKVGGSVANAVNFDCTSCHKHEIDADGTGNEKNSFMAGCAGCHTQPPNSSSTFAIGYTSNGGGVQNVDWFDEGLTPHVKHAGGTLPNYNFGEQMIGVDYYGPTGKCRACHGQDEETHHHQESTGNGDGNDWQDVSFQLYTWGTADGRNYDTNTHECTNIYCHSDGGVWDGGSYALPNYNYTTTPTWGENRPARTCGSCHKDPMDSNKHTAHLATEYSLQCADCHDATVNPDKTIKDNEMHVNRDKDIVFGTLSGTDVRGVDATATFSSHDCSSVYCHGDFPGGNDDTPTWGPATAALCGTCHDVSDAYSGTPWFAAEHSGGTSSSHQVHVGTYGFKCERCHVQLMDTGNLMLGSKEGHIDGRKTVEFSGTAPIDNWKSVV